ncbi:MAG: hypothetical protein A4E54_00301 [Pelotomaculum sp. PtaB.Bin117]|nr:MAG: hypothetical protein A4E54_00301 [Pelotomaculum sp. PtaB.Bin117]OPY63013.1 MAG: hypothetical protein A4E56_00970 [Pelotomaculum sp. PtaU1.Bin065]
MRNFLQRSRLQRQVRKAEAEGKKVVLNKQDYGPIYNNINVKIIFIFKKAVEDTVYDVFLSGGNALLVLPISRERLLDEFSKTDTRPLSPAW